MTIEALKEVPKFHFESHVVEQEKNEEDIDVVAGPDDQASMKVCICTQHLNKYLISSLFHSSTCFPTAKGIQRTRAEKAVYLVAMEPAESSLSDRAAEAALGSVLLVLLFVVVMPLAVFVGGPLATLSTTLEYAIELNG